MIRLSFGFCALRLCKKSAGQPGLPPFLPQSVSSLACSAKSVCPVPARSPTRPPWPCPPLLSGKKSNCREIDAANCAICVREAFELEKRNCAFLCHNSDSFNTHYEGMIKYVFHFIITALTNFKGPAAAAVLGMPRDTSRRLQLSGRCRYRSL